MVALDLFVVARTSTLYCSSGSLTALSLNQSHLSHLKSDQLETFALNSVNGHGPLVPSLSLSLVGLAHYSLLSYIKPPLHGGITSYHYKLFFSSLYHEHGIRAEKQLGFTPPLPCAPALLAASALRAAPALHAAQPCAPPCRRAAPIFSAVELPCAPA